MASPFGMLGGAAGAGDAIKQIIAQRLAQQIADQRAQAEAAQLKQRQDEARQQSTYQLGQLDIERMRENRLSQPEQQTPSPVNWQTVVDPGSGVPLQVNPQTGQVRKLEGFSPKPIESKPDPFDLFKREQDYRNATRLPVQNSEPLVPTQDANGVVVYTPRSQAAGKQRPISGAERAQSVGADRTLDYMTQIAGKFNPQFVGPLASRALDIKQATPGIGGNAAYGDFKSSVAALRNEMTRLLFSSRASDQDINRVQEQIPNMYDKPDVFLQKLRQTRTNAEALRQKLSTMGVP